MSKSDEPNATDTAATDPEQYVDENRDLLVDVLRHGDDPYARACALILLKEGGSERDVEEIKREIEERC